MAKGLRTLVTWTLSATPTGALVRLEQAGFRPEEEPNYRGALYGWKKFLDALAQVLSGIK